MTLTQILRIIMARRLAALAILAGVVAIALAASLLLPKRYVAVASVIVSARGADPVTGNLSSPAQLTGEVLATQVDIISSHNVAARVVSALKLTDAPDFHASHLRDAGEVGSLPDWVADQLLKDLKVLPSPESNVINIAFRHKDPRTAAAIANAFADAYLTTNLELTVDPARRQAAWFQDQLANLRSSLEGAQHRLADYQQQQGLIGATNRLDVENARYSDLSGQLTAAQSALADSESRLKRMEQASANGELQQLPDILNDTLLQTLKAELARAESERAQIAQKKGVAHPDYQTANAAVHSLQSRINNELATTTGSIRQAAQIAQQRVAELQSDIDQQKAHMLKTQQQTDELNVLGQEVQNAQRAYDAVSTRANELQLQSQQIQTSVAVLNRAIPPLIPASPRLGLNLLLALVLGSVIGCTVAFAIELFDRRVRTARDLAELVGMPVLVQVPAAGLPSSEGA